MTVKKSLSALVAALAVPMTALADEGAERLTAILEPLESYQASFEQLILDGSGERMQETRGRMWLSRPGRFRWEVDAPYEQVVVSDGEEVSLYDPDLEQVTVQSLDQRVTHTPALLLSGSTSELTESYQVSYRQRDGADSFTLVPKASDTLFEELEMTFRDRRLSFLQMTDSMGQETAIEFNDVEMNASIDSARFELEVPDGVDVIRETH
ncbi:MAG: outer membrane lipoprotein chaperone LolA [Pseudomonadota bacterium]